MRTRMPRGLAGDVAAVFADRRSAEEAVDDLCEHGADPRLRTALQGTESRVYELDLGGEVRRRATRGALIGAPVGAVVGPLLVLAAVTGDQLAGFSTVDAVWAGGLPGIVAGLVFGGFGGLVSALWVFDDIDRWMAVRLTGEQVLVVARAHPDSAAVKEILRRHGGRPVGESAPARTPRRRPRWRPVRHGRAA